MQKTLSEYINTVFSRKKAVYEPITTKALEKTCFCSCFFEKLVSFSPYSVRFLERRKLLWRPNSSHTLLVPHFYSLELGWIIRTHWSHQRDLLQHMAVSTQLVFISCAPSSHAFAMNEEVQATKIELQFSFWQEYHDIKSTQRHLCGSEEMHKNTTGWPEHRSGNRNKQLVPLQDMKRRTAVALCFLSHSWANLMALCFS